MSHCIGFVPETKRILPGKPDCAILRAWETRAPKAACPPFIGGATLQTHEERRALPMYVTYADLIQLLIFIVALVGLAYEIFKDRRN